MKIHTVMHGEMQIPDEELELILELDRARKRIMYRYSRYEQSRIDYLECALDRFRRLEGDV